MTFQDTGFFDFLIADKDFIKDEHFNRGRHGHNIKTIYSEDFTKKKMFNYVGRLTSVQYFKDEKMIAYFEDNLFRYRYFNGGKFKGAIEWDKGDCFYHAYESNDYNKPMIIKDVLVLMEEEEFDV